MNRVERQFIDFLRDEYGLPVGPGDLWPGGNNHTRLAVTYEGKRHVFTINHKDATFNLKRQDIRRALGPPPLRTPQQIRRSIDELMPPPPSEVPMTILPALPDIPVAADSIPGWCSVASYAGARSNAQMRFVFSTNLVAAVFPSGSVRCETQGDRWLFYDDQAKGRQLHISKSHKDAFEFYLRSSVEAFAMVKALLSRKGGALVVEVPTSKRQPVDYRKSKAGSLRWAAERAAALAAAVPPTATTKPAPSAMPLQAGAAAAPALVVKDSATSLRAILQNIANMEQSTEYRLVKVRVGEVERWEWRAPSIRLDD